MRKPGIAEVKLVDRDRALAEFTAATGLQDLVERLSSNPLPHSLWVYPKANVRTAGLEQLQIDLGALTGVSQVILDSRWLKRLNAFTDLLRTTASVLFLVMALGVVLTLGNTLRLGIEARRDEIVVIKLIGGGNAFARRPFLYTGLFTGALGGVMASLLSGLALVALNAPVNRLFELYDQVPAAPSLVPSDLFVLILTGAGLGLISAWYSAQLHLTRIHPK
jgi:cell division transport system permease protein